jgi:hypothetical protein
VSGGMGWFRFTQDGDPLYLNYWDNPIVVRMPQAPGSGQMNLYMGIPDTTFGNVNWVPNDSLPPVTTQNLFSVFSLDNSVYSASLEGSWVNCDHAFATYTSTDLTVEVPDDFGAVASVLVFDDYNTIVRLKTNYGDYTYNFAPLGYQCVLIAFAVKDGKLYTFTKPLTIINNQTITVQLNETDAETFATQLEALN